MTEPQLVIRYGDNKAFLFVESIIMTPTEELLPLRHKVATEDHGNVMALMQEAQEWANVYGYQSPAWKPVKDADNTICAMSGLLPDA